MNRSTITYRGITLHSVALFVFLVASLLDTGVLSAATPKNLALPDTPLDAQVGVPPNVLLTLDTSGSMASFYLPDSSDNGTRARDANSDYNYLYFNPKTDYTTQIDNNASLFPSLPSFTAAWPNGYDHTACSGNTVDLSKNYAVAWGGSSECTTGSEAAYYYTPNNNSGCTYPTTDDTCYTKNVIDTTSPAADQKNFAYWYSFYRSRILMAKTTATLAFAAIPDDKVRVSQQTLQTTTIPLFASFSGTARTNFFNWLQTQTASGYTPMRAAFSRAGEVFTTSGINSPYATIPGTQDEGVPGSGKEYSCRQNYNIAITDGYWNTTGPSPDNGDYDGASQKLPYTTFGVSTYTPGLPYSDVAGTSKDSITSLADIAFYYWITDLRSDLKANVPVYIRDATTDYNKDGKVDGTDIFLNPLNDPANWHHMVNFTIPLGLTGDLHYDPNYYQDPFSDPSNSSYTQWPAITNVNTDMNSKIDDLWHAAINSRGGFFAASDPTTLLKSLGAALNSIEARSGSAAALGGTDTSYQKDKYVFQAIYDPTDWHGDLVSYSIIDTTNAIWHAAEKLNTQDPTTGRTIVTYNPESHTGVQFNATQWSSLSAAEQTALQNTDILNYLRGDKSKEKSNGGTYRNRNYILGDIVHSAPEFVGPPNLKYPDSVEATPYSAFATKYASREPIVYVGANDGMLHGFDANTGFEKFAFVPSSVYPNLASLSSPSYTHKFFVDGSQTSADVYYGGNWHTILVGSLGNGGQEIYALDITDPSSFSYESTAAGKVLWEYTDSTDADGKDLGFTFSTPAIQKMNNNEWVAIFGNGYNNTASDSNPSTTGDAVLYIRDIQTGAKIATLDTGVGMAQDPTGQNRPNGLSTVGFLDVNGDFKVDYIYAGDLFGNLWKFDVSDVNPANWTVSKNSAGNIAPLFVATDAAGNRQPITSAPVVGQHASKSGFIINFGTGKYLESSDVTDTSVQSIYGIWDRNEAANHLTTIPRQDLLEQTILTTNDSQFAPVSIAGVVSETPVPWYPGSGLPTNPSTDGYLGWFMDLEDKTVTPSALGERVIYAPLRKQSRIIFVTMVPSEDPCNVGYSWITELNATTGMRLPYNVFDYNGDAVIDDKDLVNYSGNLVPGSRYRRIGDGGVLHGLYIAEVGTLGNQEVKLSSTSSGSIVKIHEQGDQQALGRRSWIQLLPP